MLNHYQPSSQTAITDQARLTKLVIFIRVDDAMEIIGNAWLWLNILIAAMLALDLGVFNRKAHRVTTREALLTTCIWVGAAISFNAGVYYFMGAERGVEWTTAYLIEKALSVDNVFVFAVLMSAFAVPEKYQHRLLFFGVIGALVMRLCMILAGAYLLEHFHWLFYVFGAFLIFTGWRMFRTEEEFHPENQPFLRWIRSTLPISADYHGSQLFTIQNGKRLVTPFFLALVAIEFTDLIFAIDSIPAVFAVTNDPFVVYSSNAFAILGLRSLYFLLADAMDKFHYLKHGLGIILTLVGTKMVLADWFHVSSLVSLLVILAVLLGSIIYSLRHPIPKPLVTEKEPAGKR